MKVTLATYHRLAKLVGLLLTLMGVALVAVFVSFMLTGGNPFADTPVNLNGPGLLILASLGAFTLPLGLSLFSTDAATSARLRIAAYALGLMALLRLGAFVNADMRAVVGSTALVEFFVLGTIGLLAFGIRPENEAAVELRMEIEVDVPASKAWHVLGEQFGGIGDWAVAIQASSLDRGVEVGAIRTCDIAGFGAIGARQISEELIEFDPGAMKFTYAARSGLPRMIEAAKNRWSVQALGSDRCRVLSHASMDLRWWALPLATWIGWGMRSGVSRFTEELRHRVEQGSAHPRKLAALKRP